jgi:hypothetical protein
MNLLIIIEETRKVVGITTHRGTMAIVLSKKHRSHSEVLLELSNFLL